MVSDTIAAIATGMTSGGISVIRISGPDSFNIIESIFKTGKDGKNGFIDVKKTKSHTVSYGCIVDEEKIVDEVMILIFKNPASYTREDVVEIDCHGGLLVTKTILQLVIRKGARMAEPGEFTKRAFLNGRIDLSQAEAVINVINSKNVMALNNSIKQLSGNELKKIDNLRTRILRDTAFIEAALDDPEHISIDGFAEELAENIGDSIGIIERLIKSADRGKLLNEGINTCIVGKPNVGKSTLLNAILGEERAIVSDIEGTTRDTLEEVTNFDGITLNIIDTAGIRETEDVIEKMGVERSLKALDGADLILYVLDYSRKLDENDFEILEKIKERKYITVVNKTDSEKMTDEGFLEKLNAPVVYMSAIEGKGLEKLYEVIKDLFFRNEIVTDDEVCITSERHKECLINAKKSLEQVIESINNGMPEDFFTIDLMNAYSSLGKIIGEETDEDLINTIFREFCMGK